MRSFRIPDRSAILVVSALRLLPLGHIPCANHLYQHNQEAHLASDPLRAQRLGDPVVISNKRVLTTTPANMRVMVGNIISVRATTRKNYIDGEMGDTLQVQLTAEQTLHVRRQP